MTTGEAISLLINIGVGIYFAYFYPKHVRRQLGSGGVVRDDEARQAAIDKVLDAARAEGLLVVGDRESPVAGAKKGNVEQFVHLRKPEG